MVGKISPNMKLTYLSLHPTSSVQLSTWERLHMAFTLLYKNSLEKFFEQIEL